MSGRDTAPIAVSVEDDADLALLLEFILQREGYQVESYRDGRAAQQRLSSGPPPGLVVLDLKLPYVDGFELIACVRGQAEWGRVPLLMLTAQDREEDIVRALDAGADDYLVKPFQPEELKARLRRLRRGIGR